MFNLKQSIKLVCCLILGVTIILFLLIVNHLGLLPSMPDAFRSLPGVNRVLPVADRVSQHFSQDIVYQRMHDFELDGNTILSVSDDPMIYLDTVPEQTGRLLKIDISELSEDPTSAQIFFSFEGDHYFNESNSVRLHLENGLNIISLPYSGYDRLRLDLAEAPYITMVVNEVTSANYVLLPASFWISFSIIVLTVAVMLYFCFFKREALNRGYSKFKKILEDSTLLQIGYKSEKNRYFIAAIFVALLMVVTYLFVPIRYYNVDEALNLYIIAGYYTDTPSPLLLYSNIVFGYIMSGLYILTPIIPWYGIMHIVFIFASHVLILKSFLKSAMQKDVALFIPIALYFVLYAFFLFFSTTVFQFSTTPAMMGAAACVVVASLFCGESNKARVVDIITIVILILFSFIIRWASGNGVFRFFIVIMLFKTATTFFGKNDLKYKLLQIRTYAIIAICVAVTLISVRELNSHMADTNGMREFREWNNPWGRYVNLPHAQFDDAPELYESIGWDRDLYELVQLNFFMDERVSTDNFNVLNEYHRAELVALPFSTRFAEAIELVWSFVRYNEVPKSATVVLLIVFLVHIVALKRCFSKGKLDRWNNALNVMFALAMMGGFVASLLWLGLGGLALDATGGRINLRAFLVPLMPAACLLFWHIIYTWRSGFDFCVKKYLPVVLLACFITGAYFAHVPFRGVNASATSPGFHMNVARRLNREQYAMNNPESVFIQNPILKSSTPVPVFTVYREQRPTNLMHWGLLYSPVHINQRRAAGFDEWCASVFLRPNIYFIDNDIESAFIRYMQNRYNAFPTVTDQFDNVFVMRFIQMDQFLAEGGTFNVLHRADSIEVDINELGKHERKSDLEESGGENARTKVSVYDQPILLNTNTNYLVTFDLETESSPDSFWIEWYSLDFDLRHIRHFIQRINIEPGHKNYFGAIYTENRIAGNEIRFRIIAVPTSDMLITNFTIMEICVE